MRQQRAATKGFYLPNPRREWIRLLEQSQQVNLGDQGLNSTEIDGCVSASLFGKWWQDSGDQTKDKKYEVNQYTAPSTCQSESREAITNTVVMVFVGSMQGLNHSVSVTPLIPLGSHKTWNISDILQIMGFFFKKMSFFFFNVYECFAKHACLCITCM